MTAKQQPSTSVSEVAPDDLPERIWLDREDGKKWLEHSRRAHDNPNIFSSSGSVEYARVHQLPVGEGVPEQGTTKLQVVIGLEIEGDAQQAQAVQDAVGDAVNDDLLGLVISKVIYEHEIPHVERVVYPDFGTCREFDNQFAGDVLERISINPAMAARYPVSDRRIGDIEYVRVSPVTEQTQDKTSGSAGQDLATQPSESPHSAPDKWYVHIVGPDDVIEKTNEIDALRSANAVNVEIERERRSHANDPNWPFAVALAVRSREETNAS